MEATKKAESKEKERRTEPAPAQPLPPITIGPIVIEKGGAKVIELKKTDDGKYVGTSKETPE